MATVGSALRAAREERGLGRDDIAAATNIPDYLLAALERDEFEQLVAPVYVRGFIRLYAGQVGLDAPTLLDQLPRAFRPEGAPAAPAVTPHARHRRIRRLVAHPPEERDSWLTDWEYRPEPMRRSAPKPEEVVVEQPSAPPVIDDFEEDLVLPAAPPASAAEETHSSDDFDDGEAASERPHRPHSTARRPRKPGPTRLLVATGALAAGIVLALLVVLGTGRGDGPLAALGDDDSPTEDAGAAAEPTSTVATVEPTAQPSLTPTIAPTEPPTAVPPTATPEAVVTPDTPAAFAYCNPLGGGNYSCGPAPWRVVCSPSGPFFDPQGVIPKPIPESWVGWSETLLEGRLERIWGACG